MDYKKKHYKIFEMELGSKFSEYRDENLEEKHVYISMRN